VVIDFHGQFAAPDSPYFQMVRPTVWDASKGLPFSPFEAARQQDGTANYWKTNCFGLAEIIQYVFEMGDIQRGLVYDALKDCYLEAGIEDDTQAVLPTLNDLEKKIRQYEERRNVRNVLVRCKPIFEFKLFDEDSAATGSDILAASRRGLVVDLHRHSLEVLQAAAGAFVLRKMYKDMFKWGETSRLRVLIVLDEAHRICKDTTLPKIMKEGRKFGVVVISASQGINDFHPDVLGNAGTKVVFRTNYPASRRVSGFVKLRRDRDSAEIIEQLSVGNALVQTTEMQFAKQVSMFAPGVGAAAT
jgi:DNA helicase HerA-like ATPase